MQHNDSFSSTASWEPTPQTFPRGLAWLHGETGFKWQLHNRYWSSDCDYASVNNGSCSRRRDCYFAAIPSPSMLKHLLKGERASAE